MGYLETKRNAIMNAIASGKIPNLISNDLTWNSGYFTQSGGIASASSTNKEMYEQEYIEVDTTEYYLLIINMLNSTNYWCGVPQYQDDETFVSRNVPSMTIVNGVGYSISVTFTQPKIRISTRTYGDAQIGLYKWSDILNYLDMTKII